MRPSFLIGISAAVVIASLATALIVSRIAGSQTIIIERERVLMGTVVQIKVAVDNMSNARKAEAAIRKAYDEISRVENLFSVFKNSSEISNINKYGYDHPVKVSDEAFSLIYRSMEFSRITEGAFDITVKPLVDLWKDCSTKGVVPDVRAVKDALSNVGSSLIGLDSKAKTVEFHRKGMSIDMGAVAKGYATDMAIKVLRENGVNDAIVNSGGDMYCMGRNGKNKWKIAIQHPRNRSKTIIDVMLQDKAIDTSGDYEKYAMLGGKRRSHIIDPRIGYPIGDDVMSATVIADDSTTSDAMATALCVLGKRGLSKVEQIKGASALIITGSPGSFKIDITRGMKGKYVVVDTKEIAAQ